jgi:serine/threonine protein kinase
MVAQKIDPLPCGFVLNEYVIERRIGGGGFSLVYLAFDALGQRVAIKEYLPGGIVKRSNQGAVQPLTVDQAGSFRYGMKCFFEEGRSLAGVNHPNVVKVINFFRANETVYMVMQYEEGKTLQQYIVENEQPISESFLLGVFIPLLHGLREVHARKLLHLDIKPSNIYLRNEGAPVLIDFGAARYALSQSQSLDYMATPMYTPGFAAPEQYQQREVLGPWSDIYSVGATIYACIVKSPPLAAIDRLKKDKLIPLVKSHAGLYSRVLLELVDSMLALVYTQRPQSVFSVQKSLIMLAQSGQAHKPTLFALLKERLTRDL